MFPLNYDKFPSVDVSGAGECQRGWDAIAGCLRSAIGIGLSAQPRWIAAIECYSGVHDDELIGALQTRLNCDQWLFSQEVFKSSNQIDEMLAPYLGGDDPIFGFLSPLTMENFLDAEKMRLLRLKLETLTGTVIIYGPGAVLCAEADTVIYADMPRWEGQLRQRRGEVSNLGVRNAGLKASLQYKRSFFVDWRVCDRLKRATLSRWDYLLDTTVPTDPKMVSGDVLRTALKTTATQPFRVVPFFDPAPWGGQWMREVCGLEGDASNYGWCFDCVPEENSLHLRFGQTIVETPALNLVFLCPEALLGNAVYGLFGPEFPIRFDLLDTMGGGNLSLQVHPPIEYAQEKFGLHYTQDESYYLLDAGADASVYLGLNATADAAPLFEALEEAQAGRTAFFAEKFAARWPAKKHDHFSIPAGTIHCSGAESLVLEISATPYIFTFKLWDWGRLGMDGAPRPINLLHGRASLRPERDRSWVEKHLIDRVELIDSGPGWREERTGLHSLEFIETRRHWFTGTVSHDTQGTVNVLNLVEGAEALVESPDGHFSPFIVHYAETFIVPAAVGPYTVRPHGKSVGVECATLKAYVRC